MNLFRAMRLAGNQAQAVLEEYTGPRYEIEKQALVSSFCIILLVIAYVYYVCFNLLLCRMLRYGMHYLGKLIKV